MAAVKYAPPAMPPRKKYHTIKRCHSGDLSTVASLVAPLAEGHDRADTDDEGRPHRHQRVGKDVALGQERLLRQGVGRRLVEQEEERVEPAERPLRVGAVELRVLVAHLLELRDPLFRLGHQLVPEPELDRLGGARLGAGGAEAGVDPVVAERAIVRPAGVVVEGDDAERAGADAVPAAVADVLVDGDRAELRAVDGSGRARVEAAGLRAVLANVRHQEPLELAVVLGLLDEADEPIRLVGEVRLVLVAAGPHGLLHRQLVPLLARHLAGPATDAERRVREHRQRASHGYTSPFSGCRRLWLRLALLTLPRAMGYASPFFTLQTNAFVSWM